MKDLTAHEELIRTIETLTEEQALALLHVARVMQPTASETRFHDLNEAEVGQPMTWEEGLARAVPCGSSWNRRPVCFLTSQR